MAETVADGTGAIPDQTEGIGAIPDQTEGTGAIPDQAAEENGATVDVGAQENGTSTEDKTATENTDCAISSEASGKDEPMQTDDAEGQTESMAVETEEAVDETVTGKGRGPNHKGKTKTKTNTEYCLVCYMGTLKPGHLTDPLHKLNLEKVAQGGKPKKTRPAKMSPFLHMSLMMADLQEEFDACTDPCVGLNYVIEYIHEDPSVSRIYVCYLCEKVMSKPEVVDHVKSASHRLQFLQSAQPDIVEEILQLEDQDDQEHRLKEHAAEIEEARGRRPLHVMMYLAGHRQAQKVVYKEFPLSVLSMTSRREKQKESPKPAESVGWHLTTKYVQDDLDTDAWHSCDICGHQWMPTASFNSHMRNKRHKQLYMERYHKGLMAEYLEEVQESGTDRLPILTKYVAMMTEADGAKPMRVKKLIIPFSDETEGDESADKFEDITSHPLVLKHRMKLAPNEDGNYSVAYSRSKLSGTSVLKVKELFSEVGEVKTIHLTHDRYGIVEYGTMLEGMEALAKLGELYEIFVPGRSHLAKLLEPKKPQLEGAAKTPQQEGGGQAGRQNAGKATQLAGRKRGAERPPGIVLSLDPLLAACTEVVIGLDYIEAQKKRCVWKYACTLCDVGATMEAGTALAHIKGNNHRYLYVRKHSEQQDTGSAAVSRANNVEKARMLEQQVGRGTITIVGKPSHAKDQRPSVSPGPPRKTMRMDDTVSPGGPTTDSDATPKPKRKRPRDRKRAKPPKTGDNVQPLISSQTAGQPTSAQGKYENAYTALTQGRFANYAGGVNSPGTGHGAAGGIGGGANRGRGGGANRGRGGGAKHGAGGGANRGVRGGANRGAGRGANRGAGQDANRGAGRGAKRGKGAGGATRGGYSPGMGRTNRGAGRGANHGSGHGIGQGRDRRESQPSSGYRYDYMQGEPMGASSTSYYPGDNKRQLPLFQYPETRYRENDQPYGQQEYPRARQFDDERRPSPVSQYPGGRHVGAEQQSRGYQGDSQPYYRGSNISTQDSEPLYRGTNINSRGSEPYYRSSNIDTRQSEPYYRSSNINTRQSEPYYRSSNINTRESEPYCRSSNINIGESEPYYRSSNINRRGPQPMDTLPAPQASREGAHQRETGANSNRIFTLLEGLIETWKSKNNPAY